MPRPATPMRLLALLCLLAALGVLPHSAFAREVRVEKDVVYGTADGKKLLLDAYQPDGMTGKRPGIVLIHGGGWMGGDKSFYAAMGKRFAGNGYVAFSLNYRLVPAARYPAQLDDVQRAVRWIRAHADTYHLDPDRIGALGDSAGGHLSALLGLRDTRDNSDTELAKYSSRVQCVFDLYGPTDFTLPPSSVSPQAISILTAFFGKKPQEAPDLYREGSPITYVDKTAPPFLIVHGTGDTLVPVDQSQRLYEALKTAGTEASLILVYKAAHGFLNPANPKETGALADEFFARHLKP